MTNNDTNTLNGALMELGETLAENLTTQGVTASASDGLTTLAGKILDIQGGGDEPTPPIPSEYQKVEYIENTSTSYINTGYSITSDVTEQSIKFFGRPSGASSLFGAERNSAYTGVLWTAPNSVSSSLFIGSTKNAITEALQLGIWHTVTIKTTSATNASFIVDGYERTFTYSGGILKGYPIWLFNNNNNSTAQYAKNKIARFQITDNGVKVRDLIPCYRKADGVIGMYDVINDVFYTNNGSGTFTKGADI